jgi:DNA-directed RNA polymerase specialized sigma24 family protein
MAAVTQKGPGGRRRDWTMNLEAFDRLLSVLDPDRARAGELYERIRAKLIFLFRSRGCPSPSDLADATFDRAAHKLLELGDEEIRDATAFICRVAQFLLKEDYRTPERKTVSLEDESTHPIQDAGADAGQPEGIGDALAYCLELLAPDRRQFIKDYYQGEKRAKKEARVRLARSSGMTMNALSMRAYHIRRQLEACVDQRLKASSTV